MKTCQIVLSTGITLIAIAVVLISIYEIIAESNSPLYSLENVVIQPQENQIGIVTLHGEKEASISLGVKQKGTPVKVTVSNEDGIIVGELASDKRFDVIVFENPFPNGQFIVTTSNLGDESVNVFVGVKDVKELGTYIDSPEAWWYLIPPSGILGALGFGILLSAGILALRAKNRTEKEHTKMK